MPFAEWGQRASAGLIDLVLVFVVGAIVSIVLLGSGTNVGHGVIVELIGIFYIGLMVGSRGRTLGMMAVGTSCCDRATGGPIGYGRAFARAALFILAWDLLIIPWVINILWPLWDPDKQTVTDKIVDAVVLTDR